MMQAPPSIKNNPNVLPMPAELFQTGDDKENTDMPPMYNSNSMVFIALTKSQNDMQYGGFDDLNDQHNEGPPMQMRAQPMPPMGNYMGNNRMRGGMHRHNPKPRMGGRGGKSMIPRIPHHGGGPRMHMGNFQPY
jgi:hypothetical protein